ncbi:SDR family oxidoreductase [Rhodobacteraceae bacterium]|nr:SDR family oxidoreductase [Paracoccaceae bacterium]
MRVDLLKNLAVSKRWLVTGAAGFIGSHLVHYLLEHGQNVIGLDNFSTGSIENLEAIKSSLQNGKIDNFSFIEGDISDFETCNEVSSNIDFVLHQAALGSVPRSIADPITTNASNINGFLNMLKACADNNVNKFVYAASSSTYGDHTALPKKEDVIGKPLSPYAVTKYVNELYAEVFSKLYAIQCVGLRYFNVFGPRQDPQGAYAAVIPRWINASLNEQDLIIHGDGNTSRDFCYVENVIHANIQAALCEQMEPSVVYNIAYGERTTLNNLLKIIKQELEKLQIFSKSNVIYTDFRTGDVRHSLADISLARKSIDYNPKYDVKQGLAKTVEWYAQEFNKNNL